MLTCVRNQWKVVLERMIKGLRHAALDEQLSKCAGVGFKGLCPNEVSKSVYSSLTVLNVVSWRTVD